MTRARYSGYEKAEGSSHFELVDKGEAQFLQFGCDYEQFETGAGNYSTAILLLEDGTLKNVPVDQVKIIGKFEAKQSL